jgi:hypothetical protein
LKEQLDSEQQKAVKRAKKLRNLDNPSSNIYLLIDELEKVKKELKNK